MFLSWHVSVQKKKLIKWHIFSCITWCPFESQVVEIITTSKTGYHGFDMNRIWLQRAQVSGENHDVQKRNLWSVDYMRSWRSRRSKNWFRDALSKSEFVISTYVFCRSSQIYIWFLFARQFQAHFVVERFKVRFFSRNTYFHWSRMIFQNEQMNYIYIYIDRDSGRPRQYFYFTSHRYSNWLVVVYRNPYDKIIIRDNISCTRVIDEMSSKVHH